jgi:hypothetical protein
MDTAMARVLLRQLNRFLQPKSRLRFRAVFALAGIWCFLPAGCSREEAPPADGKVVYDFIANQSSAEIPHYQRERVNFNAEFTINKEKRRVLWEHPTAEVEFPGVTIPEKAVLQFGIGINPDVWSKTGDGVTFEVTVVDEKSAKNMIFSDYINPKAESRHRKWLDHDIDLKDFAGQKVSFIFGTTFGPRGDGNYDWAGWSNLRVRLRGTDKRTDGR